MIPKIIHFIWLGKSSYPELTSRCIASWKKYCPDYQIMEWNEENFPIDRYSFVKEAYEARKYAYASDFIRLWALYNYGGVYCDTDLELVASLDGLLDDEGFIGFQQPDLYLQTALMGFVPEFGVVSDLLDEYQNKRFIRDDGTFDLSPNTWAITTYFNSLGLRRDDSEQVLGGVHIYPSDYFCPIDWEFGEQNCTERTIAIHHFDGSWTSKSKTKMLAKILGPKLTRQIKRMIQKRGA